MKSERIGGVMTIYSFQSGKVCGHWQAFDRLGFLMQMGGLT